MNKILFVLVLLPLLSSGCQAVIKAVDDNDEGTETDTLIPSSAEVDTPTDRPTYTPSPTDTPTPSNTPTPSETPTSTNTPSQAELDKKTIKEVVKQLIEDWNQEDFPETWDDNITDDYRGFYLGLEEIFQTLDQLEGFFGNKKREIVGDIEVELFNSRSDALASMRINYGDKKPIDFCDYYFRLIKEVKPNSFEWLIDSDKTLESDGLQLCPK